MPNYTRIWRLYVKDLLDILRDRRTLVAMIVVPIVLYPALMLGSIQAASVQVDQLKEQPLIIGVQSEYVRQWLTAVLREDVGRIDRKRAKAAADGVQIEQIDPIRKCNIVVAADQPDLQNWVRESSEGDCALEFDYHELPLLRRFDDHAVLHARVCADSAEIYSAVAGRRLLDTLKRWGRYRVEDRVTRDGKQLSYINPLVIDEVDVASAQKRGGSMLGQVIPIILILMTMTGAIYPAIDVTAGERERGTLETLMVCPIPVSEITLGKFLVVASVSIFGALLNLTSMGLTLQFGGFNKALAAGADTQIPLGSLPLILLFLIPLAVFFSALLLAICSFARTFKEAQNYITPVIIAVLVPAGVAALPGSELEGAMVVMPVANMVLLTREMLLGNFDYGTVLIVLLSTTLYAATAVALAVRVFGQEAVMFADSGSWQAQFDRHLIRPSRYPRPTLAMMNAALLFPTWFFLQSGLQMSVENFEYQFWATQILMILCFAVIPLLLVAYYKIKIRNAFGFKMPVPRYLLAAVLMGVGTWALSYELILLQKTLSVFGVTDDWLESTRPIAERFKQLSPLTGLLLIAIIPGVCEEIFFRGMLLHGLRTSLGRWKVLVAVAVIFACYHYLLQRFVVTFALGVLLAYLCWQARSVFPAMIVHIMHNATHWLLAAGGDEVTGLLGIPPEQADQFVHLPWHIVAGAIIALLLSLLLCRTAAPEVDDSPDRSATLTSSPNIRTQVNRIDC